MAQIYQEVVLIKLSKLIKDDEVTPMIAQEELTAALEQIAQELVGNNVIVEIERS